MYTKINYCNNRIEKWRFTGVKTGILTNLFAMYKNY